MREEIARDYYEDPKVVDHYMLATTRIGLWVSEKQIIDRYLHKEQRLMDLGCGTGRIAFGLEKLGYTDLVAVDFSKSMVQRGYEIAQTLESKVKFLQGDARELRFENEEFDGIIFGFNGLMQIPGNNSRVKAMGEVFRILKPGGYFIFTGHDRALANQAEHWKTEQLAREGETAEAGLGDFGDVVDKTPLGLQFIHSASVGEVAEQSSGVGFELAETCLRSELGNESMQTREFSDECRFWILRKPE